MLKVIVNSTPIIALGKSGLLYLLEKMYGEITVPEAVFKEVTRKNDEVREEILRSQWIHVEKTANVKSREAFAPKLHEGEVEVMILAMESKGESLAVVDDYAARKAAQALGLRLTGTVGILIRAKELGYIESVFPAIEKMEKAGIYLSEKLKSQIKRLAGEQ